MKKRILSTLLMLCMVLTLLPINTLADFTLVDGAIQGQVFGAVSGTVEPVGETVNVAVYAQDNLDTALATCTTDVDGVFTLTKDDGFSAGNYTIVLTSSLYLTEKKEISIPSGSSGYTFARIDLAVLGKVYGTVTDATTGTTLSGVKVEAYRDSALIASMTTDASGVYSLEGERGECQLVFIKDGYNSKNIETKLSGPIGEELVDVQLATTSGGISGEKIEIIASGDCSATANDHVSWTLGDNGVLTISGTGNMRDYTAFVDSAVPWYTYKDSVLFAVIGDGITSIGGRAFKNCTELTGVTIPDCVISIGNSAFYGCSSLTSVTIPNSITSIDSTAFYGCSGLTSVTIPDSVTSIGRGVFENCSGLLNVTILKGFVNSGGYMFSGCSSLISVIIPDGVTYIGEGTFRSCIGLTNVSIPNSVTSIGSYAFFGCKSLTSVTIPDGAINIGNNAFEYCDNLTSVTIPDSVTSIGNSAFEYCTDLSSVTILNSVTSIGSYAFYSCNNITDVYFNGTEDQWKTVSIGGQNTCLTSATIHYNSTGPEGGGDTSIGEITLQADSNTVAVGDKLYVTASMLYNGDLQESDITWTSSDDRIASVTGGAMINDTSASSTATITGISEGTATITVSLTDGRSAEFEIIVAEGVYRIKMIGSQPLTYIGIGETVHVDCWLYRNDERISDWDEGTFTSADPSIALVNKRSGHSFEITGVSNGTADVIVTDSARNISVQVSFNVDSNIVSGYSYWINSVPTMRYPGEGFVNFYNVNGLYVDEYHAMKSVNGYHVSFDVYNSLNMYGSVDVYNSAGKWIKAEKIDKLSYSSSVWDTIEDAGYLIADVFNGEVLTYKQDSFAQKTHIEIEVPEGGYFTISNNFSSPGVYFYNAVDYVILALETAIDLGKDEKNKCFEQIYLGVQEELSADELTYKYFMNLIQSDAKAISKEATREGVGNTIGVITGSVEDLLGKMNIDVLGVLSIYWGWTQEMVEHLGGPAGKALKGLFTGNKYLGLYVQTVQIQNSINTPYVTVMANSNDAIIKEVSVAIDDSSMSEAILQVNQILSTDTVPAIEGTPLSDGSYDLYNIRYIKNGAEIQIPTEATIHMPVPHGYNRDNCKVLRQEESGNWTDMNAQLDGDYLVFTTSHLSLYAIVDTTESAEQITLHTSEVTLDVGNAYQLLYDVSPVDCNRNTIKWFSSDPLVVTVDGTGALTAISEGVATITATLSNGKTAQCKITVHDVDQLYTLLFAKNGGTGYMNRIWVSANSKYTLPECTFLSPNGLTFKAWNINGAEYQPGQQYMANDNLTLTAIWQGKSGNYTITLDPVGGILPGGTTMTTSDAGTLPNLPAPTRSGYTFDGWYTATSGGEKITTDHIFTSDTTVYAHWTKNSDGSSGDASSGGSFAGGGSYGGGSSKPSIKPGVTSGTQTGPTTPESSSGNVAGFSDVVASAWYADFVQYVVERGLFGGVGNGRFAPDENMTRAMMWTVLARYKGVDTNTGANWYEAARTWAMEQDISDGTMANDNVTREQFVTMLWRLSVEPTAATAASFTDSFSVSDYAKMAVDWAVSKGIVNGYNDGSFKPQGNATRAEVAKMLTVYCVINEG